MGLVRSFHRVWLKSHPDDVPPEAFEANWRRLQELHPGFSFTTWDDPDALDWLQNRELFDSFTTPPASYAFRADIVRYEVLRRFGGCYLDTDVTPLRSMADLFDDDRPFISWCSEKELDPAVIASPAEHPAITTLVDDLAEVKAWMDRGRRATPPGTTGPGYVTARWRERDDVRRFPPITFFPYHWQRMQEAKGPFPERSYAVHHWAAGWKFGKPRIPPAPVVPEPEPSVSFIVAFRDADGHRTALWDRIRPMLQRAFPDSEIIVGTDDGIDPFHKTLALNRAAREATGEVLCIWDSDTWLDPEAIHTALRTVGDGWARPWASKLKLHEDVTHHILSLDDWNGEIDRVLFPRPGLVNNFWASPPLLVSRAAWDTVGGADERIRGWGGDDECLGQALKLLVGNPRRGYRTQALHLWHPRLGRSGRDMWVGQDGLGANDGLTSRYRRTRTPEAMRALLAERDLVEV